MWKTATILTGIVLILLAFGIVMLSSTSSARAEQAFGNPNYFLIRQAIWMAISLAAAAVAARIDYHRLRPWAVPLMLLTLVLLGMVLIPGVGLRVKGSSRWLRFGPMNVQPSEIAKFSLVLFLAWWMSKERRWFPQFWKGFAVPALVMGLTVGLVFKEPDFSTTLLLAMVGGSVMLFGGMRLRFLVVSGALGFSGFVWAVMQDSVRMNRVISFLDPERYAGRESYQLMNAIYAFVIGGGRGAGLGAGMQKHFYLPEAHTDFIFAIIGEELGIGATMGVLVLFFGIFICGLVITARAPDYFGRILAFGITMTLTLQALINIGVVTGSLPTTGIALPFISYGGSSLLVFLGMIGVLINIALHASGQIDDEDTRLIKDRVHRL
ncbi:MAG: putative lipid II flippase FtsW [Kiritimatiellia bacterium]|nr:putative lipid II flippase FtsW [Kiritimatiellia bacterium]